MVERSKKRAKNELNVSKNKVFGIVVQLGYIWYDLKIN